MPKRLLFPDDVRHLLARRFDHQHRTWLVGAGSWPLNLSVGALSENQVREDPNRVRRWVESWRASRSAGTVEWQERVWAHVGRQSVPIRISFSSANEVADAIGKRKPWQTATTRYQLLTERWPQLAGRADVSRQFDALADYSPGDFDRIVSLLAWLEKNPSSGFYLRQLPIEGLHTKWIEKRTSLVIDLVRALQNSDEADLYGLCGLRRPPHRLRLRVLCPELRRTVGGLSDIEAPIDELSTIPLAPTKLIIAENLETGIAFPEMPGCVAVMKLGHAVTLLGRVRWLRQIPKAVYWGDIDTHGFVALDRARLVLPELQSVLMDEATLLANRGLWGEESAQHPEVELPRLGPEERTVYERLRGQTWGERIRLEQERLPWDAAVRAITAALA
ncbi:MAG TPA: DUF3322 domain-containing protein [Polyangia bacterium]|nr:DUF3322 domain-containing protein [Polyangia bacterium]